MKDKIKFNESMIDGVKFKICPKCKSYIKQEWEHAYKYEWCPMCGLNMDAVKDEMKDIQGNL